MAELPRSVSALRRVRSLGDHVGNAERLADDRPEPVGRLVVEVVGEPKLRPIGRRRPAPIVGKLRGIRLALRAQRTLARFVAIAVVAAESRGHLRAVTGGRQRIHQQPCYPPITRGRAVSGRLKRCVERDPHAGR